MGFLNMKDIIAKCVKCHCKFVQKYWDEEISWYIELNITEICNKCKTNILNETSGTSLYKKM